MRKRLVFQVFCWQTLPASLRSVCLIVAGNGAPTSPNGALASVEVRRRLQRSPQNVNATQGGVPTSNEILPLGFGGFFAVAGFVGGQDGFGVKRFGFVVV